MMGKIVVAAVLLIVFIVPARAHSIKRPPYKDHDCEYSIGGHWQSSNNKSLIRDVRCENNQDLQIFCKFPYPQDEMEKEQKLLKNFMKSGTLFGSACTQRVICEMSEGYGYIRKAEYRYPDIRNGSSDPQYQKYVEAFQRGEQLSCYKKLGSPSQDMENLQHQNLMLTGNGCQNEFPRCDEDIKANVMTEYFYKSFLVFNQLDMWFFSASLLAHDTFEENTCIGAEYETAIRQAYKGLVEQLDKMASIYQDWIYNNVVSDVYKYDDFEYYYPQHEMSAKENWNKFLIIHNHTDPKLVDSVFGCLDYETYKKNVGKIQRLLSENFLIPGKLAIDWNAVIQEVQIDVSTDANGNVTNVSETGLRNSTEKTEERNKIEPGLEQEKCADYWEIILETIPILMLIAIVICGGTVITCKRLRFIRNYR